MKKFRKLSIMTLLTVFLLSFGATSTFAKRGWADSIDTAQPVYFNTPITIGQILEEFDQDYYSYENTSSSNQEVSVTLNLPPGVTVTIYHLKYRTDGTVDFWPIQNVSNYLHISSVLNAGDKLVYGIINTPVNGSYGEGVYQMRWEKVQY